MHMTFDPEPDLAYGDVWDTRYGPVMVLGPGTSPKLLLVLLLGDVPDFTPCPTQLWIAELLVALP